jgi:CubicO group peptidase (beta-lactamase class C family)
VHKHHEAILVLAVSLAARGAAAEQPRPRDAMTFPGEEWEVVAPAEEGMDATLLTRAVEGLRRDMAAAKGNLDNALLIRRGRIVWQTEAAKDRKVEHIWSAAKSVASSVLGAMCDRNLCALDTRIAEHLPEFAADYGRVTLRHCFTMTSAIRLERNRPIPPPYGEPGTVYGYCDGNISVGGRALETIGGRGLDALFAEYVGEPIGMRIHRWSPRIAAVGIHTSAHDLARLGHLFLNRGRWRDRQIISAEWVALATRVQVPREMPHVYGKHPKNPNTDTGRYGIAWWLNGVRPDGTRPYPDAPASVYKASGWQGNRMFVVPEWEVVFVVLQTKLQSPDDPRVFNAFLQRLRGALPDPEPSGPTPTGTECVQEPPSAPRPLWHAG